MNIRRTLDYEERPRGMHRGRVRSNDTFARWFSVGLGITLGAGVGVVMSAAMIMLLLWAFGGGA